MQKRIIIQLSATGKPAYINIVSVSGIGTRSILASVEVIPDISGDTYNTAEAKTMLNAARARAKEHKGWPETDGQPWQARHSKSKSNRRYLVFTAVPPKRL